MENRCSKVSNILWDQNIKIDDDVMQCDHASSLMKRSYLHNNINCDEWKCNLVLEMIDSMYGLHQFTVVSLMKGSNTVCSFPVSILKHFKTS